MDLLLYAILSRDPMSDTKGRSCRGAEDVLVDLLSTAKAREREWRRFGSPRSLSLDLLHVSSIEASDSDEGEGMRFWLRIGLKRTFD